MCVPLTPSAVSLPLHVGQEERKSLGADGQSAFCSKISISAEQSQGDDPEGDGLTPRWIKLLSAFRVRAKEVRRRQQAL